MLDRKCEMELKCSVNSRLRKIKRLGGGALLQLQRRKMKASGERKPY